MSGAKHAPGPWASTDNNWEVSSVYGPDDCLIAEVQIHASVTEDNQHELEPVKEANARLIAAAPDLLEALKVAENLLMQTLNWKNGWECSEDDLLGGIRAAIAKAEGRL